jgi:hypothetical protein
MINFPITIQDDFATNPESLRDFALSLDYTPSPTYIYPGGRTKCLSLLHPPLFEDINKKILKLFFPENDLRFKAITYFHNSKDLEKTGWIHQDPTQMTAILYLSKEDPNVNRGTSLFSLKSNKFFPYSNPQEKKLYEHMHTHYQTNKISNEIFEAKTKWESQTFSKILDIPDKFNRLICFDPFTYHSNNNTMSKTSPERLTLISFITHILSPEEPPTIRSKRTNNC